MPESLPKSRCAHQFTVHHDNKPLHQRVPTHDDAGRPLADFMILIPKLNNALIAQLKPKMASKQAVLLNYH